MENAIIEKYKNVEKYLLSEYKDLIKSKPSYTKVNDKDFKIFFCWWQGKGEMPYIIRRCYENLKSRTKHKICFIDKNNYMEYVEIPSYIIDKLNKGTLIQANFSDVLRFSLLKKHGGMWTDGSIFYTDDLDNHPEIFNSSMWSIRNYDSKSTNPSQGRWQAGVHSTNLINNPFHSIGTDIFVDYLKKHESFPVFFFVDCIMSVLYYNNSFCKEIFDEIKDAHHWPAFFRVNMNETYQEEEYNKRTNSGFIHLLSWKKAVDYEKDSYIRRFFKDYDRLAYNDFENKREMFDVLQIIDSQHKRLMGQIVEKLPVYRLMATWLSILCCDSELRLFHSSTSDNYIMCRCYKNKIAFFVEQKMQYVSEITADGKCILSNEIVFFDKVICSESDMVIGIRVGDKYLSAVRGGGIELAEALKGWEKFSMIF